MKFSTANLVCLDKAFLDTMEGTISYVRVLELQYEVNFRKSPIKSVLDDTKHVSYLQMHLLWFFLRFVRQSLLLSRCGRCLPTLQRLMIKDGGCKEQGVLHLDCKLLYSAVDDLVPLMPEAASFFIEN